MSNELIPVIIPAYEPDERLCALVDELISEGISTVIVVNDGSADESYAGIFDEVKSKGATVLKHAVNMGKGRALKTAFNYCLNEYPSMIGAVTADSDGQHKVSDIKKCMEALLEDGKALVLGVRDFDRTGIPARSVFGNKVTSKVMKFLTGLSISDTQTGLRGISSEFMRFLLTEKGERFEFETNMLLDAKDMGIEIKEIPIATIYLEENRSSHFNPIKDSIRIYAVFFKFLFSSLSSSVLDIVLFGIFCGIFRNVPLAVGYIMLSTILARIISALYNFFINYKVVFRGKGSRAFSALKYFALALCIMLLSGSFVSVLHGVFYGIPEVAVKIPVDCILFLGSFFVQREVVYK